MIDPVSLLFGILVSFMLMCVATVALRSYLRVRSWKLLALGVSFSLLAVPNVVQIILTLVGFYEYNRDINQMRSELFIYIIFEAFSLLAIAILAYVYRSERKAQRVKITKPQWIIGGLLAIATLTILLFFRTQYIGDLIYLPEYWALILVTSIILILEIYVIISLYSYYHIVKNKNTLVVMTGFVCLLSTSLLTMLYFILTITILQNGPSPDNLNLLSVLSWSLTFVGYALFLVALLRLKGFR